MDRDAIPVVEVRLLALHEAQFLLGIVNQRAEVADLHLAQRVGEEVVDLA